MKVDLHNHTIHSDGVYTEEELVKRAVRNHIDVFALTDHDSVFGCDNIVEIGKKYNVRVIKGLELSTVYKGESIHVVCLFKGNVIPKEMMEFSIDLKEKRKNRAIKMLHKLHDIYGLKIDEEELLKGSEVITRANLMRHIAKHNNLTFDEAKVYCEHDSKAYIPSTKMTTEEGLALARKADCIAIFAHPCLVKNPDYVREILDLGFDGIEVRYPKYEHLEPHFRKLALEYNLLCSAGSDCHGDATHSDIGTCTLNEEEFLPIAKVLNFEI